MIVVNQMRIQALRADVASQIEPYIHEKDNFPLQCNTLPLTLGQMLVTGCCPSSWLPLWWPPPSTPRNARSLQCHPGPGRTTSTKPRTVHLPPLSNRKASFASEPRYMMSKFAIAVLIPESQWQCFTRGQSAGKSQSPYGKS